MNLLQEPSKEWAALEERLAQNFPHLWGLQIHGLCGNWIVPLRDASWSFFYSNHGERVGSNGNRRARSVFGSAKLVLSDGASSETIERC